MNAESVEAFVSVIRDCCSGFGFGIGDGYGYGYGYGFGDDFGFGFGSGSGDGSGSGFGSGDGSGDGDGDGDGSGSGFACEDIARICGEPVYMIDEIPTILRIVHGNLAKGSILKNDFTLELCYVAKMGNCFAHGRTAREAIAACREKMFEELSAEERVDAFVEAFPNADTPVLCRDLYEWHHRLTGSCEMGRDAFAREHGIDVAGGTMTVREFIQLTRGAYGWDVIEMLEKRYEEAAM